MSNRNYPYIPNSDPAIREEMLRFVGADSVDELIERNIPRELLLKRPMALPRPLTDECGAPCVGHPQ